MAWDKKSGRGQRSTVSLQPPACPVEQTVLFKNLAQVNMGLRRCCKQLVEACLGLGMLQLSRLQNSEAASAAHS